MGEKAIHVMSDDWEGIYVAETLVAEGHSIDVVDAMKIAIDNKISAVESKWVNGDWIRYYGNLPTNLREVIFEDEAFEEPEDDED